MKMINRSLGFILSLCAFSFLLITAYATDINSSESVDPAIETSMTDSSENNTQAVSPRADTFYKVLYNNVNIRSGPGTSYSSYGYIHSGQIVLWDSHNQRDYPDVFADGHYWKKIIVYNGVNTDVEGWVARDNLQKLDF